MSKAAELAALIGSQTALSNRNLIINGAMQVAQRGTSSTSSGIQTVDRFSNTYGGSVAVTQTQDTTVPSGQGFSSSYKHTCTTADTATSAYFAIQYRAEAQDIRNSGWNYTSTSSFVTLSFWARSSVAGTYMCQLRTVDGTAQNISSQYTLVADTWKKVEVSFPGNSNLTFDNNNDAGMNVYPMIELGTNYTTGSSFDTWTAHASGTQSPDANILFHDTANATFFVTGVQLELGEQATPFEHRSFGDELARCQRYFQSITTADHQVMRGATGTTYGAAHMQSTFHLPAPMRVAPTLTNAAGGSTCTADGRNTSYSNVNDYELVPQSAGAEGYRWYYSQANNGSSSLPTSVVFLILSDNVHADAEL